MARPQDRVSKRMCAGCGQRARADELVRLVVGPSPPYVAVDLHRRLGGRGLSVHLARACVRSAALRGGLSKALRGTAKVEPEAVEQMIIAKLEQRALGLLIAASRKGAVAVGAEAVRACLQNNRGDLLVRAKDSRSRAEELGRMATAAGCATATWGTKAILGDAFNRAELGVLLVMDRGIARALLDCVSHIEALSEDG